MNKYLKITSILLLVSLAQSVLSQDLSSVSISPNLSVLKPNLKINTLNEVNTKNKISSKKKKDIYFDISDLNFISKVDISSNTLHIKTKVDNVTYDKAQLTNLETNSIVLKMEINESNNVMNLENVKPGKYMLIISNEAGNIKSEELLIFIMLQS